MVSIFEVVLGVSELFVIFGSDGVLLTVEVSKVALILVNEDILFELLILFRLMFTPLLELTILEIIVPLPCIFVPLELIMLFKILLKIFRVISVIVSLFVVTKFEREAVVGCRVFVKILVTIPSNEDVIRTPNLLVVFNKLVTLICILLLINNGSDIVVEGIIYCELCLLVPFSMFLLLLFKTVAFSEVLLELVLSNII